MTTETSSAAPAGATAAVRGFRQGDETAIRGEMLAARERGEYDSVEDYQLEHALARLVPNPTSCAVAEVGGRLAGWVIPADDELRVVPAFRRRGVGRQLVEAGRSIAARSGRSRLRLWVPRHPGAEAFASACGLRYTSSLWQMRLAGEALAAVGEPELPTTVTSRRLVVNRDEPLFVAMVNRIFLDHPTPLALDLDEVRRVHNTPGFDPSTVLVVEDAASGEMIAFCRVHAFTAADGVPSGEVRMLGVDRRWRGRGLGRMVTAWGVAELRRRGAVSVVLVVEGANEGALRLYRDLGFRPGTEWPHWTVAASSDRR